MSSPGSANQPGRAALWMTGAIASFSSMAVAGRAVAPHLDTFEIMMYRSFIGIALVLLIGGAFGQLKDIAARRLSLHLARNACHFTGQNLWFYALTLIPLAQLFALEFTSPIWVMVFAAVILGETLTKMRVGAVALGFVGALIVANPGGESDALGLSLAAASAVGFAGSIVLTKMLTRTETTVSILFWLTVMQAVMGLVAAGYDGAIALPPFTIWPWVILIGASGLFAHLCVTKALTMAPAVLVVPMDFLRLPAIAIVGAAFFGEAVNLMVFLGAGLIFAANFMNVWAERKLAADL